MNNVGTYLNFLLIFWILNIWVRVRTLVLTSISTKEQTIKFTTKKFPILKCSDFKYSKILYSLNNSKMF